jgi:hypothetical protein
MVDRKLVKSFLPGALHELNCPFKLAALIFKFAVVMLKSS